MGGGGGNFAKMLTIKIFYVGVIFKLPLPFA